MVVDKQAVILRDNPSARPLYQSATRAAWVGLLVNLSLGLVKLVGGLLGSSFALISDAVNSLGDSLTSIVVLFGLWFAQRPPDDEHPYGHTKAEAIAGSHVAIAIILSALYIGWEAIQRWNMPHAIPPVWTLWIAGSNVLIKEWLFRYKHRIGVRTGSSAIIASAMDHRSDALCSGAVLAGLVVVRLGGPNFIWADELAAVMVVLVIVGSGIQLFRSSTSELLDLQADPDWVQEIRRTAETVSGVRAVEKLRVRKTGIEYLADIHIQVDAGMSVYEGHRIGHEVKNLLVRRFDRLRDVLVHLEPFPHSHS
jgi:cation diffusion facilitator family transporter